VFKWLEEEFEIVDAPDVDAVPVVHGRWIDRTKEIRNMIGQRYDCSNCGHIYWFYCADYNYCPNCGAKMDGGNDG
jgi:predicted RNA-binding Zn-ribbon protein involved in translation (DUF1610 family)